MSNCAWLLYANMLSYNYNNLTSYISYYCWKVSIHSHSYNIHNNRANYNHNSIVYMYMLLIRSYMMHMVSYMHHLREYRYRHQTPGSQWWWGPHTEGRRGIRERMKRYEYERRITKKRKCAVRASFSAVG